MIIINVWHIVKEHVWKRAMFYVTKYPSFLFQMEKKNVDHLQRIGQYWFKRHITVYDKCPSLYNWSAGETTWKETRTNQYIRRVMTPSYRPSNIAEYRILVGQVSKQIARFSLCCHPSTLRIFAYLAEKGTKGAIKSLACAHQLYLVLRQRNYIDFHNRMYDSWWIWRMRVIQAWNVTLWTHATKLVLVVSLEYRHW